MRAKEFLVNADGAICAMQSTTARHCLLNRFALFSKYYLQSPLPEKAVRPRGKMSGIVYFDAFCLVGKFAGRNRLLNLSTKPR